MKYLLAGALFAVAGLCDPLTIAPPAGIDVSSFRVTAFATGLNYPTSMTVAPDGSLLVGVATSGLFTSTSGALLRLSDPSNTGVASTSATLFSGLPGAVVSVRPVGDLLAVSSSNFGNNTTTITFLKPGANPSDSYTHAGQINFAHTRTGGNSNALAVRETPGAPGSYDLFFSTTSEAYNGPSPGAIAVSGLTSGTVHGANLYRVQVTPTAAGSPVVAAPQLIATGVRNSGGLLVDASTGDLYFSDNGVETAQYNSADTLNRIPAATIGNSVVDFGYPGSYTVYETGAWVGAGSSPALYAFTLQEDPLGAVGANEIAFAPSGFPTGLNSGIFTGFHGVWDQAGSNNQLNPVIYVDPSTGQPIRFVPSGQAGVGHLIGVASTPTSLFLSDFSSAGGFTTSGAGRIYQISFVGGNEVPEPATSMLGVFLAAGMLVRLRWRKS